MNRLFNDARDFSTFTADILMRTYDPHGIGGADQVEIVAAGSGSFCAKTGGSAGVERVFAVSDGDILPVKIETICSGTNCTTVRAYWK